MTEAGSPEGNSCDVLVEERGRNLRNRWFLDEEITYLNHGAFGALPREVYEGASDWRLQIERQPAGFIRTQLKKHLRDTADYLGDYVGADGKDIVFLDNASTALNAVLRSLVLLPGDEVLITNHTHISAIKTLEFVCGRAGARLVTVNIPYPLDEDDDIAERLVEKMNPRTRLLLVDHISSPTTVVFPVAQICEEARDRGIPILIDGAHAPGSLPLRISDIACDWYIGNCHKWLGASRGCAFLWTREELQKSIRPTTISNQIVGEYTDLFDWPGTKDFAPYLSVRNAIQFRQKFGEAEIYSYSTNLIRKATHYVSTAWSSEYGVPPHLSRFMNTIAWPQQGKKKKASVEDMTRLRNLFRDEFNIEVEITLFNDRLWVRISAFLYNEMDDYKKLADAGLKIIQDEMMLS